jgi:hypothetical protein
MIIGVDLAITIAMATPGLSRLFVAALDALGGVTGWAAPIPHVTSFLMFCLNLAGVLGVAWNSARWVTASYELARMDAVARLVVAALIVYYVVALGVTPVLLLFVVTELFGSLVQFRVRPLVDGRVGRT